MKYPNKKNVSPVPLPRLSVPRASHHCPCLSVPFPSVSLSHLPPLPLSQCPPPTIAFVSVSPSHQSLCLSVPLTPVLLSQCPLSVVSVSHLPPCSDPRTSQCPLMNAPYHILSSAPVSVSSYHQCPISVYFLTSKLIGQ